MTAAARRRGDGVSDRERCQSMNFAGRRCPYRHVDGTLCDKHKRFGAIVPDGGWTQPDNLPIFALPREEAGA